MKKFAVAGLLGAVISAPTMAAPFTDIAPNHWAYKQISALKDAGIIKGYPDGKLKGQERISRYEASQMVYNALQYVNRMKMNGGSVDPQLMDTINALIMELTDEMQIAEVRIEENSNAINALRHHVEDHHSRGASMPMGNGRIKFMGQAMFSVVSGGDNSAYSATNTGVGNPAEGATEFIADYFDLGIAADIDDKTSFHTRASIYTGGDADRTAGGNVAFDDYMYFHVNDLWSNWDMTLGRTYLPIGHEVKGAFRTNPYFVTTSMVEQMYGYMTDGAFFSNDSYSGDWHWGVGINNGEFLRAGNRVRNHANHTNAVLSSVNAIGAGVGGPVGQGMLTSFLNTTTGPNVNQGGMNNNSDDEMGYILQVGNSHHDGDFKWDLSWITNGGDLTTNAGGTLVAGNAEQEFLNFGMTYRANEDWQFNGEYVDGSVQNFVPGVGAVLNAGTTGVTAAAAGSGDLMGRGSATGVGTVVEDDFTTWYLQAVYNVARNQTLGVRYSSHEIERAGSRQFNGAVAGGAVPNAAGVAGPIGATTNGSFDDEMSELTFAWTRKISDNGTLILEYSTVDVDMLGGINDVNSSLIGAGDDFDVIRASYRIDF